MIAVDTNILVRLLTRDDEAQFQRAFQLFNEHQIFIATTVILECEWVLRFAYRMKQPEVVGALRRLCGLEQIVLDEPNRVAQALSWHEQGMDFADALHLAAKPENAAFSSFDRKLLAVATRLGLSGVEEP